VDRKDLVNVVFRIDDGGSVYAETPWARRVGPNEYALQNLLWSVYGISLGDVFEATPEPDDPRPHFRRVLRKSGNCTVRLALPAPAEESEESATVLETLVKMGCAYENADGKYMAVNVPPLVDLDDVAEYLTKTGVRWEHADPTWESLHPEEASDDDDD
jgi:hypothetical protein